MSRTNIFPPSSIVKDNQLTEKDNQLTEKDNQLKSMAQVMLNNGMSLEVIAQAMGKNVEEIKTLLGV